MSFWSFLGELVLLEWLFGHKKQAEVVAPPSGRSYNYENDCFNRIHSSANSIVEFEYQHDKYDILSDRYDDLQSKFDDIYDELDDIDDF